MHVNTQSGLESTEVATVKAELWTYHPTQVLDSKVFDLTVPASIATANGVERGPNLIRVDAGCSLAKAINEANGATRNVGSCEPGDDGTGATRADRIELTGDITLGAHPPDITSNVIIHCNGYTIDGANLDQPFNSRHRQPPPEQPPQQQDPLPDQDGWRIGVEE